MQKTKKQKKCPKCNHRIMTIPCRYCHREHNARYQSSCEGKLRHKFRTAKYRAKRDGIVFTLEWDSFREWAMSNGYPALWEKWITLTGSDRKWNTPSLDRIDNDGPYSIENLQWTTWHWNWNKEQETHWHRNREPLDHNYF